MLLKTSTYVKSYNGETKWIYFLIENDDLLEKHNTLWDKVCVDIKKKNLIRSLCIYIYIKKKKKKKIKTKIKSHGDEVTIFFDKKVPKN